MGDFKAIPFDTKQQLISYHTEGQGEDKVLSYSKVNYHIIAQQKNLKCAQNVAQLRLSHIFCTGCSSSTCPSGSRWWNNEY